MVLQDKQNIQIQMVTHPKSKPNNLSNLYLLNQLLILKTQPWNDNIT